MASPGDLSSLFQRLADTLVRLFSDRIDLARLELRQETERLIRILAALLIGAIAAAVGLVMLALGATEILSPLVKSRAGRLFLVGGPLLFGGVRHLAKSARTLVPPAQPDADMEAAKAELEKMD